MESGQLGWTGWTDLGEALLEALDLARGQLLQRELEHLVSSAGHLMEREEQLKSAIP